ncbi:MAG: MFS transporter [Actinobacteria bacterium]|nr:MAG: MFS transporter [Actinomycetota bacterium]
MLRSLRERLAESRRAFAAVFTNPGLRRLELSWTGTVCAYWIFIVTLSLFAYEHGGAGAVGLVGLLRVLPSVVASPFGAVLGDRYPRERVMVGINLARSLTIAGAAVAAFAGAPAGIVYALGSLMGLLQSTFRPTQAALLPQLARSPEELTAANLVLTTIEGMGIFLGPAIGGLLLATTGTDVVFAATAGVFLVSAFLLVGVRVERGTRAAARVPAGFLREVFAGYRTVAHDARLRLVIGLYGAQTLVAGALNVLIVVAALELLDLGKAGIGYLNSAVGVGGLVGGFGALALLGRTKLASDFGVGLVLLGLPIALIGVFPDTAVALVLLGVVGVGTTIVDVAGVTLLQRAVPDDVLTRVMGVVQSVFVGTLGIGAVIAPLLTSAIHVRGALIATGAALPVLTVLAWTRLRALDAQTAAPARGLELLRGIALFRPLPPATIEQLAANLIPVHAAAGTEIVRQGAIGDRFYIVARGELDVTVDGRPGEPLLAGDHFGEIALLHDVPRTATVRARTDVELLALDRDEFIGAVTGHPESAEAAHAVVAARLASLRPSVASV